MRHPQGSFLANGCANTESPLQNLTDKSEFENVWEGEPYFLDYDREEMQRRLINP
jgi:hypothetical protein